MNNNKVELMYLTVEGFSKLELLTIKNEIPDITYKDLEPDQESGNSQYEPGIITLAIILGPPTLMALTAYLIRTKTGFSVEQKTISKANGETIETFKMKRTSSEAPTPEALEALTKLVSGKLKLPQTEDSDNNGDKRCSEDGKQ